MDSARTLRKHCMRKLCMGLETPLGSDGCASWTTRNMALIGCSSLYGGLPVSSSMARHPTLQMSDALDTLVISITCAAQHICMSGYRHPAFSEHPVPRKYAAMVRHKTSIAVPLACTSLCRVRGWRLHREPGGEGTKPVLHLGGHPVRRADHGEGQLVAVRALADARRDTKVRQLHQTLLTSSRLVTLQPRRQHGRNHVAPLASMRTGASGAVSYDAEPPGKNMQHGLHRMSKLQPGTPS